MDRIIEPGLSRTEPINFTSRGDRNPRLIMNMTVRSSDTGQLARINFRISNARNLDFCENGQPPYGCVYSENVSNQTMIIPFNATGAYYFIFENNSQGGFPEQKSVSYSYAVREDVTIVSITRDGPANWIGLGLVTIGSLAVLYGLSRKTIIPWE